MRGYFSLLFIAVYSFGGAYSSLSLEETINSAKNRVLDYNIPKSISPCSLMRNGKKVNSRSIKMAKRNQLFNEAKAILMSQGVSASESHELISKELSMRNEELDVCSSQNKACDATLKYRSIDGTCNNLQNPFWGAVMVTLKRVRPSRYEDDESSPTATGQHNSSGKCTSPGTLPLAREVSHKFSPDNDVPSMTATHLLTQMGQFLDHDLSFTPETHIEDCCEDPEKEGCFVIDVPSEDSFFSGFGQTCLEFTRSEKHCSSSPREQFNTLTSFVDASNVYGSSEETLNELRKPNSFLMKVSTTNTGKDILPSNEKGAFLAGDERAIEMPGLASMHTLFVREHNRIANLLFSEHPEMSNEEVFEETRRIVGAEMQNIVFGQYLRTILGRSAYKSSRLNPKFLSRYSSDVDPSISNVFATAAFRFGHSMIQGDINRVALTSSGENITYALKDNFFNMENYLANDGGGMEEIINGLINQPSQTFDRFVVDDISNLLFNEGKAFGSDLIARNIQRGRDHGLPSYGEFRRLCNLRPLSNWFKRPKEIKPQVWKQLRSLYKSPNDIDIFIGGLAEKPVNRGFVGRTFECLISQQFRNLKNGDRFFFTHRGQSGSFTKKQIANLRTRTLGQIICDNTDIQRVRGNVFSLNSKMISCQQESTLLISLF